MRNRSVVLLSVLFGLMLGCQTGVPSSDHQNIDTSGAPLRAAFNQDSGKVRAIILASAT